MTVTESRHRQNQTEPARRAASWLGGLVALAALAGCGGGSGGGGNEATPRPVVTPTATATPGATPTPTPTPPPLVGPSVLVTPETATLTVGDALTLQARVTGTANQTVIWQVREAGGGTISAQGVYRAPLVGGTYHIVAVSEAFPSYSATVRVTVQSGTVVGVVQ